MPQQLRTEGREYDTRSHIILSLIKSHKLTAHFLARTDFVMDYLVSLMVREVDIYRQQSFEKFGLVVNFVPASGSAPIHNLAGTFIGFDRYIITTYSDPPKSMRVRLHRNGQIKVFHLREWCTVSEFMDNVRPPTEDWQLSTSSGQYERQFTWWLQNGKKFRILDLFPEVREKIYGFVFGQRIEPYPTCKARRGRHLNGPISAPQSTAALLRLNRQVHEEASHFCFLYTPFFIEHKRVLGRLMANKDVMSNIRRLHLSLSHYEFLRLFGVSFLESDTCYVPRTALAVRSLALNVLELQIAPPSLITETFALDGACQKTVVNWILAYSWPFVNAHPVQVTGYLKNGQKASFEAACLVSHKRLELWRKQNIAAGLTQGTIEEYDTWSEDCQDKEEGGVSLVEHSGGDGSTVDPFFTTAVSDIQSTKELPPRCRCTVPCALETWSSED